MSPHTNFSLGKSGYLEGQCQTLREFPDSQQTVLQGHSSPVRIPNGRGFFQGERGTTSATKGTTSAQNSSGYLIPPCSQNDKLSCMASGLRSRIKIISLNAKWYELGATQKQPPELCSTGPL